MVKIRLTEIEKDQNLTITYIPRRFDYLLDFHIGDTVQGIASSRGYVIVGHKKRRYIVGNDLAELVRGVLNEKTKT